ncbi:type II toxin-antitoxin system RelE/ParE family toxin [Roseofilum sp. BLCC_M91]|uniref:Type II toxin-antitoxin system RelE/ParE family toxin n=1 Tax=Roseofilum halophilum BLCC-M91 TaxID=3022259 RepID=A0ABT7BM19_9CYAN|nr:type II toxin-antitoxin system RelE/ParE family toxin [Roseofilum halophilum]MDJ1180220.1 type II toxin-antitoxin system RelE/ParE family toxin [Roseofilum halophilum BLCC-M91]
MNRYIIAPSASRDLNEIIDYFAQLNIEVGERFIAAFQKKCKNLMNFPQLGRSYGEIREGLRGIPLNGYIILYQITDDTLEILRVVHGSRNLNPLFEPDEEESG